MKLNKKAIAMKYIVSLIIIGILLVILVLWLSGRGPEMIKGIQALIDKIF